MKCEIAQKLIKDGLRPGVHSNLSQQLGFHLSTCSVCQQIWQQQQHKNIELLKQLLKKQPPKRTQISSISIPKQTEQRRIPIKFISLVLTAYLIGGIWMLGFWQPQPEINAQATDAATDTPALAGGLEEVIDIPQETPSTSIATQPTASATIQPTATATARPTATKTATQTPELPQNVTILLLGLDRRPQETEPSRSDAILVLHLNLARGQAALISFPRDLWMPLPDQSQYVKLNAAYMYGEIRGGAEQGAALAEATVEQVIGQPIDHTIVTTFEGLMHTVDILGGVTVDVPKYIYDPEYPTFDYGYMIAEFQPGVQHMDGATALIYSRTRHADNDFERGKRQQQILLALLEQFRATIATGDDATFTELLMQLYTDSEYTDLDLATAAQLARWVQTQDQIEVNQESIDLRYGYQSSTYDGAYIIQPDLPAIQQRIASLFGK